MPNVIPNFNNEEFLLTNSIMKISISIYILLLSFFLSRAFLSVLLKGLVIESNKK